VVREGVYGYVCTMGMLERRCYMVDYPGGGVGIEAYGLEDEGVQERW
jgi:hypothetical protein